METRADQKTTLPTDYCYCPCPDVTLPSAVPVSSRPEESTAIRSRPGAPEEKRTVTGPLLLRRGPLRRPRRPRRLTRPVPVPPLVRPPGPVQVRVDGPGVLVVTDHAHGPQSQGWTPDTPRTQKVLRRQVRVVTGTGHRGPQSCPGGTLSLGTTTQDTVVERDGTCKPTCPTSPPRLSPDPEPP